MTVEHAGTETLRILLMQNTNDFLNSENTKRLKAQASSAKQQAIQETVPHNDIEEASSSKHGGKRTRPAIIDKIHDQWCVDNGYKLQAPSSEKNNPQASSPKRKGSSFKPESTSSRTADPS